MIDFLSGSSGNCHSTISLISIQNFSISHIFLVLILVFALFGQFTDAAELSKDVKQQFSSIIGSRQTVAYYGPAVRFEIFHHDSKGKKVALRDDRIFSIRPRRSTRVVCSARWLLPREDQTSNEETVPVYWTRDGVAVTLDGTLRIERISLPGTYRCTVYSDGSRLPKGIVSSVPIVVLAQSEKEPGQRDENLMEIQTAPDRSTVIASETQGGTIRLHCLAVVKKTWKTEESESTTRARRTLIDNIDFYRHVDGADGAPKPRKDLKRKPNYFWTQNGEEVVSGGRVKIMDTVGVDNVTHVIAWQDLVISDVQRADAGLYECFLRGDDGGDSERRTTFGARVLLGADFREDTPFTDLTIGVDQKESTLLVKWRMLEGLLFPKKKAMTIFLLTYYMTEKGSHHSLSNNLVLDDYTCDGMMCWAICCQHTKLEPASNYTFQFSVLIVGGSRSPLSEPMTLITWDAVADRSLDLFIVPLPSGDVQVKWKKATIAGTLLSYHVSYYREGDTQPTTVLLRGANYTSTDEVMYTVKRRNPSEKIYVRVLPETLAGLPKNINRIPGNEEGAHNMFPFIPVDISAGYETVSFKEPFSVKINATHPRINVTWSGVEPSYKLEIRPTVLESGSIPTTFSIEYPINSEQGDVSLKVDDFQAPFYLLCLKRQEQRLLCQSIFLTYPRMVSYHAPDTVDMPMMEGHTKEHVEVETPEKENNHAHNETSIQRTNGILKICLKDNCTCSSIGSLIAAQLPIDELPSLTVTFRSSAGEEFVERTRSDGFVSLAALSHNSSYVVTVSINDTADSFITQSFVCTIPPQALYGAPIRVTPTRINETAIRIEWVRSPFKYHRIPAGWAIRVHNENTTDEREVLVRDPLVKSSIVRDLEPDNVYHFSMAAVEHGGKREYGAWTDSEAIFLFEDPSIFTTFSLFQVITLLCLCVLLFGAIGAIVVVSSKRAEQREREKEPVELMLLKGKPTGLVDDHPSVKEYVDEEGSDSDRQNDVTKRVELRNPRTVPFSVHREDMEQLIGGDEIVETPTLPYPQLPTPPPVVPAAATLDGIGTPKRAASEQALYVHDPQCEGPSTSSTMPHAASHDNLETRISTTTASVPHLNDSGIVFDENHHPVNA